MSSDSHGTVFLRPEARARHLEPLLQLERVRRDFMVTGDIVQTAVADVSLAVARGELVAIVGPPGCGKSTLVSLIAALDRPTSGRIVVAGEEIAAMREARAAELRNRSIGIVRSDPALLEELSTIENIMLPMLLRGARRRAARERAEALVARFDLGAAATSPAGSLSSEDRQRASLARALANDPPVLIADEPTARLDTAASARFLELLTGVNREGGTVIFATADESLARLAPRRLHMLDGRIVRDDESPIGPG